MFVRILQCVCTILINHSKPNNQTAVMFSQPSKIQAVDTKNFLKDLIVQMHRFFTRSLMIKLHRKEQYAETSLTTSQRMLSAVNWDSEGRKTGHP